MVALALCLAGLAAAAPAASTAAGRLAAALRVAMEPRAALAARAGGLSAAGAASASALAASSGRPAEVLSDRTDFSQTYALPGGGFEAAESLVPYEVKTAGGSWVPVDTALSVRGGVVTPRAVTTGLTLSDGGSVPVFTLSQGGAKLSVSWPFGELPKPSLSGSTATYRNVLPGVNLLVSATPTGVSDVLEVMSAAAAANPALARLTFPVSASGLSLSADSAGDLTAVTSAGRAVFAAAAPEMWDSSGSAAQGLSAVQAAQGPLPGETRAALGVQAGARSLSLIPATFMLSGRSVTFPLYIDPSWNSVNAGTPTWSDVFQQQVFAGNGSGGALVSSSTSSEWKPTSSSGGIKSGVTCDAWFASTGDCGANPSNPWAGDTVYQTYRSFVNFSVPSAMAGASYADGQLVAMQQWAWGCGTTSKVVMYDTATSAHKNVATTTNTTWASQPATGAYLDSDAHGYGASSSCPAKQITLNARQAAETAANNNWGTMTLRLSASAADEGSLNQWSWKRYDVTGASPIELDLYWRNAPGQPTGFGTSDAFNAATGQDFTDCSQNPASPDWVQTASPELTASISDPDQAYDAANNQSENINGEFGWHDYPQDTNPGGSAQTPAGTQGGTFTATLAGTALQEYAWQVYGSAPVSDPYLPKGDPVPSPLPGLASPGTSSYCYVEADTNAYEASLGGSAAPVVTSATYVNGGVQPPATNPEVGTPGTFMFTGSASDGPGEPNDIVGFAYGFSPGAETSYVPASSMTSTSSSATVTITPLQSPEQDLYVEAIDHAGWPSQQYEFVIKTSASLGAAVTGSWPMDGSGADSLPGAQGADLSALGSATFQSACNATPPDGHAGCLALNLAGSGDNAVTPRTVVSTAGPFSVSVWAGLQTCATRCTVLSEDGRSVSAFTVGYQASGTVGAVTCSYGCWVLSMPGTDTASPVVKTVAYALPSVPPVSVWTNLTGVFNGSSLLLYVNGTLEASLGGVSGWSAPPTGPLRVGADVSTAADGQLAVRDYWSGWVSDACVFYGALSGPDAGVLAAQGADGCAAMQAKYG